MGGDEKYEKLVAKVIGFIESPGIGLDLPLDIRGTAFQQRVWKELQRIPAGRTTSYSEVAKRIGFPKSTRAVAQACGANTIAVAVPCHRVLRNDGDISGYRWLALTFGPTDHQLIARWSANGGRSANGGQVKNRGSRLPIRCLSCMSTRVHLFQRQGLQCFNAAFQCFQKVWFGLNALSDQQTLEIWNPRTFSI
ncbi:MAG: methylated-DNA--[protein]-cysteine S-methyltransferase, partial [Verrucomicrobia bacterium]|nr:methylated-DNA--[protein]-cysteine S-methyltransferase [Verrucomicrobiota bacterium]